MPRTLMQSVVSQLHKERTRLEDELHRVTAALTAFGRAYMHGSKGMRRKRIISAAGRKKIAAAQRARWARARGHKQVPIAPNRGKRSISAAGRKRIAAAARARWAKFRAAKKTA